MMLDPTYVLSAIRISGSFSVPPSVPAGVLLLGLGLSDTRQENLARPAQDDYASRSMRRTLNATGQSQVTLSLWKEHLRAAWGAWQEEREAKNDARLQGPADYIELANADAWWVVAGNEGVNVLGTIAVTKK